MSTPYGKLTWHRHVYQSSRGGSTYSPAERHGGLVRKSTPRLAKLLQEDYAHLPARTVVRRFAQHHGVTYGKDLVNDLHDHLSEHLKAVESRWKYESVPAGVARQVAVVAISRDGAMAHMLDGKAAKPKRQAGYRECMCGTISLYDKDLKCLHTTYVGVGPQKNKPAFTDQLSDEVAKIKRLVERQAAVRPTYVGVADGAGTNWPQLTALTDHQVTDYYHVSERLAKVAACLKGGAKARHAWLKAQRDRLLKKSGGADLVIAELRVLLDGDSGGDQGIKSAAKRVVVAEQLTYLVNQRPRLNYYRMRQAKLPIGSGPVEAGCKTLIKQRLGQSGMRWLIGGADDMLITRGMVLTGTNYDQYWDKRMRYRA